MEECPGHRAAKAPPLPPPPPPTLFPGIVHLWHESASPRLPTRPCISRAGKSSACVHACVGSRGLCALVLLPASQEPWGCLINRVSNLRTSSTSGERGGWSSF